MKNKKTTYRELVNFDPKKVWEGVNYLDKLLWLMNNFKLNEKQATLKMVKNFEDLDPDIKKFLIQEQKKLKNLTKKLKK